MTRRPYIAWAVLPLLLVPGLALAATGDDFGLLASTGWRAEHLEDPGPLVSDCSVYLPSMQEWAADPSSPLPGGIDSHFEPRLR